jgi:O-antigen/teichoic acid export membrane protein
MKFGHVALTKGAIWTTAQFIIGQIFRFSTNVILTRLLAPELFGIMTIVNTLRTGVELTSDVGIGQSIIYNKSGEDPDFYNTAWTINVFRGVILWIISSAAAIPAAYFYQRSSFLLIIPISSVVLLLSGLASISPFLIQKRLEIAKLTTYEIILATIWTLGQVAFAYFIPTVWGLIFGMIFGSALGMVGSYFLIPGLRHKLMISRRYIWQILHLGKWIFLSSAIYFLSMTFDRFYLASVIPLALLGVYGIARSISEIFTLLVQRLGNIVIFPYIALHSQMSRPDLKHQLLRLRFRFLLIASLGFALSAATVDVAIRIVFDYRYHEAGWMVPVLIVGGWVTTLCSVNESTLLGIGTPRYGAIGSGLKYVFLLVALPLSFRSFGTLGAIAVVAVSDACRYIPTYIGQVHERIAFGMQDFSMTVLTIILLFAFEWLRWILGFGTSFENLPSLGA